MRLVASALVALAGCGFDLEAAVSDASGVGGEAPADAVPDAPRDAGDLCLAPKIWEADFSTDPETLDVNGDSIPDWDFRNGLPRPGTISGGVWVAPTPPPLDTQPKQDFRTRTRVEVKMRSVGDTPQTPTSHGAVFWINVGYGDADFAPLWLDANRLGATQSLHLYTKNALQQPIELAALADLGLGFIDATLDIDPTAHTVELRVGAMTRTATYTEIPLAGDDRWATLVAFSSSSEFDYVKVAVCP